MEPNNTERRRGPRAGHPTCLNLRISTRDRVHGVRMLGAKLVDSSENGLGIDCLLPLKAGTTVTVSADGAGPDSRAETKARVVYCLARPHAAYHAGLHLQQEGSNPFRRNGSGACKEGEDFIDFYEVLQLSPNAHIDTIHRVYRMLAQRLHPDNKETGSEEAFKQLLEAYRVLSDPESRAAYDVRRGSGRQRQWIIFDHPAAAQGAEAERRKREGILGLLYTKRRNDPDHPGMNIIEMEELLACPREHLEFSLWYLKEAGCITRTDNGKYLITVKGVDQAEAAGVLQPLREDRLLTTSRGCAETAGV